MFSTRQTTELAKRRASAVALGCDPPYVIDIGMDGSLLLSDLSVIA